MGGTYKIEKAMALMGKYLMSSDHSLLQELYRYGDTTGKLAKSDILQAWNGVSLKKLNVCVLRSLFEFLNSKFDIGDVNEYFGPGPPPEGFGAPQSFEKKETYLATIGEGSKRAFYTNVLTKMSKLVEPIFEKDLCEMGAGELLAGLTGVGYANRRTISNELLVIRHYTQWCHSAGFYTPDILGIQNIKSSDIPIKRGLASAIIPTPKALRKIIDSTRDKDEGNNDSIVVCLYWLGLTPDEVYDLKTEDVDLIEGRIKHPHFGSIAIPGDIIDIFKNYAANDEFQTGAWTFFADKTEYFLHRFMKKKALSGDRMAKERVPQLVTKFRKDYFGETGDALRISGINLNMSGACWRLFQREKSGEEINNAAITYEARIKSEPDAFRFHKTYKLYKELFCGE